MKRRDAWRCGAIEVREARYRRGNTDVYMHEALEVGCRRGNVELWRSEIVEYVSRRGGVEDGGME